MTLFVTKDMNLSRNTCFFGDFPQKLNYFRLPCCPDYCLTTLPLNFGCYHLRRLKLLRGDQVAFYQWENRNDLKSGLLVNLQKTGAKRTRFHCLTVVRKELSHRNIIEKLLQSGHCGQTCLSPGPQIS